MWVDLSIRAALVLLDSPGTLSDTSPDLGYCATSETKLCLPHPLTSHPWVLRPTLLQSLTGRSTVLGLQYGALGFYTAFSAALACPVLEKQVGEQ